MENELRIGLVGCGVVGGGVAEILLAPKPSWERDGFGQRARNLRLVRICELDWKKNGTLANGFVVPKSMRCTNVAEIIEDPTIDVVVELVGGTTFAHTVIDRAISSGKDVVTANKALLAEKGGALFRKAARLGREIAFEAAVAGGIPILSAVRSGLAANRLKTIYGILNGTTNFILTRMTQTGASFEDALAEAQRLGFAEADPTLDVEGIDAAHKIHLLAALALGREVPMSRIPVQGIRSVSAADIAYAAQLDCRIKLVATARRLDEGKAAGGIEISVAPTLVPRSHPLASVDNELNAVFVEGSYVGQALFVGRGAGRYPTASAVVADLLELASGSKQRYVPRMLAAKREAPVSGEHYEAAYYLRIGLEEKPGVLSKVTGALGRAGVSIASFVQLDRPAPSGRVPVALRTHATTAARMAKAVTAINRLPVTREKAVIFPVVL